MTKSSPSLHTPLADHLRNLAAFEPQDAPVVSLYLNLAPDQHGRDNYEAFCRKAFADQLRALKEHPADHASLARDIQRITSYLANEVTPSANGLAIFSSAGAGDYFVAVQLDVPIDEHWLFISRVPHLYPLVRLIDQYPRYACRRTRHQPGTHPSVRSPKDRKAQRGQRRQDAPQLDGRLVAGSVSAPRREFPPPPRQGSGRDARSCRPRG